MRNSLAKPKSQRDSVNDDFYWPMCLSWFLLFVLLLPGIVELYQRIDMDLGSDVVGNLIAGAGVLISGVVMFFIWKTLQSQQRAVESQESARLDNAKGMEKQIDLAADAAKIANMPMLIESLKVNLKKASEEDFVKDFLSGKGKPQVERMWEAFQMSKRGGKVYTGSMYFDTVIDLQESMGYLSLAFQEEIKAHEERVAKKEYTLESVTKNGGDKDLANSNLQNAIITLSKRKELWQIVEEDIALLNRLYIDQKKLYLQLSRNS